ncbi:hypothetical protein KUTeg_016787 [Tegillarca granosa]|uniref:DUF3517 domain-containing protein n=1 Tax=Tegillarca granosa TaxID=220873 RepID=A0ABQ9EQQ9_TEGGR|nr:hypothetical protein KUTeg_016787 [Tegillarca granosa]
MLFYEKLQEPKTPGSAKRTRISVKRNALPEGGIELDEWVEAIENIMEKSKAATVWFVEYLASEKGSAYIKPFILECPNRDVRLSMAKLLERMMSCYFAHKGVPTQKCFDEILETFLQMLNKDVVDHCKNSAQYFLVLKHYVQNGTKACTHMFLRRAFQRLITFLLGQTSEQDQESSSRRWSSIQSREFSNLHSTLATLILNCDVSQYRTDEPGDYPERKPKTVIPLKFLKMSSDMENYVYGADSDRYIREVVHAVREVGGSQLFFCDMLVYCSFCNKKFSTTVLKQVIHQYMTAPSNELKPIFSLLMELLLLEDPVQLYRIQLVIDGHMDERGNQYEGLLAVVRLNHVQDSRRSYSCIKFLVNLANKCPTAKDYLMQTPSKWQWAVNWLKKKMSEYWPSTTTTVSNEDSNRKSFQRTVSAQSTLEDAKALLTELEAQEGSLSDMETNGNKTDNENESVTKETNSGSQSDTHMSAVEEEKEQKSNL